MFRIVDKKSIMHFRIRLPRLIYKTINPIQFT